jgi:PAS domain S-box-containing protein
VDKFFFVKETNKVAINNAKEKLQERELVFQEFINYSQNILFAIRESNTFNDFLDKNSDKNNILEVFKSLMKSNTDFMQLRYLDKDGLEQVRIDRKKEKGKIYIIPDTQLQNKYSRYYFKDSKDKPLEKIWFSALDLNVENGKVDIPYRPTLRAILPIKHKDEFGGIIIINYFMQGFLDKFTNMSLYDTILENNKGDTLTHFDKNKSWGYYQDKKYTISNEFQEISQNILSNENYRTEEFVSKKLNLPISEGIVVILRLNKDHLQNKIEKQNLQYLIVFLIVLVLAFISIYFVSKIIQEIVQNLNQIKRLNQKLTEINDRLHTILDSSKDGIVILNFKEKFVFFNNSFIQMTGYPSEELTQKNYFDLIKNEHKKETKFYFEKVKQQEDINHLEEIFVKKNGEECIILMSIVKMNNKEQMLIIAKDITSLKNQEHKLKTQDEILIQQSKMATMGEMLENIAHQWRQPISVITMSATGLKVKKEYHLLTDELLESGLDSIVEYAEYLSKTIDDFRDFFKKDTEIRYFNITSAIDKCLFITSYKLKNNNIKLIVNSHDEEIHSFKNQLVQVMINMINNAADAFVSQSTIENRIITINISKDEKNTYIQIHDNAGGIPADVIDKIFDQHFTTKDDSIGTGIGLYMAKDMMENNMKGKLLVENKEIEYKNKTYMGASFTVVLPNNFKEKKSS